MKFLVTFADDNLSPKSLVTTKKLGHSKFEVLLAKGPTSCEEYAVKIFPKDNKFKTRFQKEKEFLASFDHPNIIKHHAIISHDAKADILIMDYAHHGDFCDLVMKSGFQHEVHLRTYFHQLVAGLEYLHSKKIAHLDLKLENLLLGKDYLLKIIDFEQSQIHSEENLVTIGTACYRAPEVKQRTCTNMFAADIYSLGIILFVFKVGQFPFVESGNEKDSFSRGYDIFMERNEEFWQTKLNKLTKLGKKPDFISEDFKNLLKGMLEKDPSRRMTLQDIKASEWYNKPILSSEGLKNEMERILSPSNQNPLPAKQKKNQGFASKIKNFLNIKQAK